MNAKLCSAEIGSPGSNGARSLTASAPMSLIFSTDQPGSYSPIGAPALFLGLPDFSTRIEQPLVGGDRLGGDRRPGPVIGVDQDARGAGGHLPGHVELGLDDLFIRRLAVLAFAFEGFLGHLDHRAILVEGDHRQRPVGVADALEPPEFAGGQTLAQQHGRVEVSGGRGCRGRHRWGTPWILEDGLRNRSSRVMSCPGLTFRGDSAGLDGRQMRPAPRASGAGGRPRSAGRIKRCGPVL